MISSIEAKYGGSKRKALTNTPKSSPAKKKRASKAKK
jgi:hypothetical protein